MCLILCEPLAEEVLGLLASLVAICKDAPPDIAALALRGLQPYHTKPSSPPSSVLPCPSSPPCAPPLLSPPHNTSSPTHRSSSPAHLPSTVLHPPHSSSSSHPPSQSSLPPLPSSLPNPPSTISPLPSPLLSSDDKQPCDNKSGLGRGYDEKALDNSVALSPKHDSDKSEECIKAEEAEDIVVDCSIQEDALSVLDSGSKVSSRYPVPYSILYTNYGFFYGRADPNLTFKQVTIPKNKSCKVKYKKYFYLKQNHHCISTYWHVHVIPSYIPYFILVFEHEIELQLHILIPVLRAFFGLS